MKKFLPLVLCLFCWPLDSNAGRLSETGFMECFNSQPDFQIVFQEVKARYKSLLDKNLTSDEGRVRNLCATGGRVDGEYWFGMFECLKARNKGVPDDYILDIIGSMFLDNKTLTEQDLINCKNMDCENDDHEQLRSFLFKCNSLARMFLSRSVDPLIDSITNTDNPDNIRSEIEMTLIGNPKFCYALSNSSENVWHALMRNTKIDCSIGFTDCFMAAESDKKEFFDAFYAAKNKLGETPLEIAAKHNRTDCISTIQMHCKAFQYCNDKYGALIDSMVGNNSNTPQSQNKARKRAK